MFSLKNTLLRLIECGYDVLVNELLCKLSSFQYQNSEDKENYQKNLCTILFLLLPDISFKKLLSAIITNSTPKRWGKIFYLELKEQAKKSNAVNCLVHLEQKWYELKLDEVKENQIFQSLFTEKLELNSYTSKN